MLHADKSTLTRPSQKAADSSDFIGRTGLMEIAECDQPLVFKKATHVVAKLNSFHKTKKKFVCQAYNQSGDKDGKPLAEMPSDLWVFPVIGSEVRIHAVGCGDPVQVLDYDLGAMQVSLSGPIKKKGKKGERQKGGKGSKRIRQC